MAQNLHGDPAGADRSASVPGPSARYLARGVTSARRSLLLLLVIALLGTAAAVLVWSPFGVLEESAGPLDGLLPADVDVAVRLDPGSISWSPAAERLWKHPAILDAREATGLDARVLDPLRALEDRVGQATLGLAPRVDRDVLGQEIVVALRGDDVLLLSRLTARGKLLDAAAHLDPAELRELGLQVRGGVAMLERDGAPTVHLQRVRDVLVASTSPAMLATAAALGDPPDGVVRGASQYADALDATTPPRDRVLFWARPAALSGDGPRATTRDGVAGLVAGFFPPDALDVAVGDLDLSQPDRVVANVRGGWHGETPPALTVLAENVGGGADGLHAEAVRMAIPTEAVATLGLAVRAESAVLALADAQPPARRELLDEILAERDLTVELLAERIANHLEDGIAGVVSRLPETDALELDDPREGGVHPIPGTIVVFRLRARTTPRDVVLELAAEAEALFGAPLLLSPEPGPGGSRVHRLAKHRFGGEWALLRPAFAIVDGLLVFSTHDAHLLRALEHRASGEASDTKALPAGTVSLAAVGVPLRSYVDDQRWAWADAETRHDWRAEREAIRRELDRSGSVLSREDRQVYENERIAVRLERRNEREFPAAIERYREMWKPLEALRSLSVHGDREDATFRLRVEVVLDVPQPR
jgi:hypothetical protein